MNLIVSRARAYVYGGNWVSDCPRACGNVEYLFDLQNPRNPSSPRTVRRSGFHCSYCQYIADIDWPENMQEIMDVLDVRPIPHTRNWYPKGHETALKFRLPDGQSVADLQSENIENGVM